MKNNLILSILKHKTAPNLFLILMIILGLFASRMLNTQFFPNYSVDYITISIDWAGASPLDVEESLIKPIEEKVRYIDGVKKTKSTAKDNIGSLLLEFEAGTDMKRALSDVERLIQSITTLPDEAKSPEIKVFVPYEQIGLVLVTGKQSDYLLKKTVRKLRQDLLTNGIDKVEIDGIRNQVIYVDIDPISLFAKNLDVEDISKDIEIESKNIPSGTFKDNRKLQLRISGKKEKANDIKNIKISDKSNISKIKIGDISNVYETIDEKESFGLSKNQTAFTLRIFRSLGSDTLEMTKKLENTVNKFKINYNENTEIKIYDLSSQLIRDRINLLLKNGIGGLVLVLIVLFLFLKSRVVLWVALGIPAAISITLAIMLITGQSINMISLFALIMMIGIIVDDSIVVAEHIEFQFTNGKTAVDAAYIGAIRMFGPVTAASLTTVAAFAPVFLISGVIGQVIEAIPLVVISVIVASLFECFFVLPGHLKNALLNDMSHKKEARLNKFLISFRENSFDRFINMVLDYKYSTIFTSIGLLLISLLIIKWGHVKFYFFPSPEGQIILVNYNFVPGSLKKQSLDFSTHLEEALFSIDNKNVVKTTYSTIGKPMWGSRISLSEKGDHVGGMIVELVRPEKRKISTNEIISLWKENIIKPPALQNLLIVERKGGPPGLDIDIRLKSKEADLLELKNASAYLKNQLSGIKGVSDIQDNLPWGKQEVTFTLTEKGKSLGFDSKYIAKKIKLLFDELSVSKFFRGEEEIEIIVRNDPSKYNLSSISSFLIKSPEGFFVPLSEIVNIKKSQGFSVIKRKDGYREVAITAEVNENILNPDEVTKNIRKDIFKKFRNEYNLDIELAGRAEEQAETFSDMKKGALLAFGVIYLILAFIFESYVLPLSIMSIIPFTLIGVILGHWVTGFDITILSLVAVLGLAGIVINDSIILVTNIYEKNKKGINIRNAIINGSKERLRAVLLTSFTTVGGLTPLLFETSVQAQFLKPMAITIVFGLLSSTLIVLIFIPTILLISEENKLLFLKPKPGRK